MHLLILLLINSKHGNLFSEAEEMAQRLVRSTGCSSKQPGLDSQHQHGNYSHSVPSILVHPVYSSDLRGHEACEKMFMAIHVSKAPIHAK